MAENRSVLVLRLVEALGSVQGDPLDLDVSVEVETFSGRRTVAVARQDLATFLEQLRSLNDGHSQVAKLECGVVQAETASLYFGCHIERVSPERLLANVSLGAVGSDDVLQRLHIGLRVEPRRLTAFQVGVSGLLEGHAGEAVLRGADGPAT